jgi:CubicO group peptidase (beta-lactamase class C family)
MMTPAYVFSDAGSPAQSSNTYSDGEVIYHTVVNNQVLEVDSLVSTFMHRYHISGASIAISREGKLIYEKGYGYAGREKLRKVTKESLFRIASLSKFITSIAIMRLREEGRLSMEDEVFGSKELLGTRYGK